MNAANRSILQFVGYHVALLATLGMLVACSQVVEDPHAPPAKVQELSDIGADRFQITKLPNLTDANISNAVALYDKQHDVICYVVTRNSPSINCVKL